MCLCNEILIVSPYDSKPYTQDWLYPKVLYLPSDGRMWPQVYGLLVPSVENVST